jgi:hypothetical protein
MERAVTRTLFAEAHTLDTHTYLLFTFTVLHYLCPPEYVFLFLNHVYGIKHEKQELKIVIQATSSEPNIVLSP